MRLQSGLQPLGNNKTLIFSNSHELEMHLIPKFPSPEMHCWRALIKNFGITQILNFPGSNYEDLHEKRKTRSRQVVQDQVCNIISLRPLNTKSTPTFSSKTTAEKKMMNIFFNVCCTQNTPGVLLDLEMPSAQHVFCIQLIHKNEPSKELEPRGAF